MPILLRVIILGSAIDACVLKDASLCNGGTAQIRTTLRLRHTYRVIASPSAKPAVRSWPAGFEGGAQGTLSWTSGVAPDRVSGRLWAHVITAMYSSAGERAFDPLHESAVSCTVIRAGRVARQIDFPAGDGRSPGRVGLPDGAFCRNLHRAGPAEHRLMSSR
jgi:hypothetical protein